uniref:Uncharacterized protein n=1 Tax=Romanomermis culicivorax TaxID=13658 RepID=A0A915IFQ5_ROMCU
MTDLISINRLRAPTSNAFAVPICLNRFRRLPKDKTANKTFFTRFEDCNNFDARIMAIKSKYLKNKSRPEKSRAFSSKYIWRRGGSDRHRATGRLGRRVGTIWAIARYRRHLARNDTRGTTSRRFFVATIVRDRPRMQSEGETVFE